jgi:hypothetical protein
MIVLLIAFKSKTIEIGVATRHFPHFTWATI